MEDKEDRRRQEGWVPTDFIYIAPKDTFYGYVPNYPPPLIDTNPFNLIEGNENKTY